MNKNKIVDESDMTGKQKETKFKKENLKEITEEKANFGLNNSVKPKDTNKNLTAESDTKGKQKETKFKKENLREISKEKATVGLTGTSKQKNTNKNLLIVRKSERSSALKSKENAASKLNTIVDNESKNESNSSTNEVETGIIKNIKLDERVSATQTLISSNSCLKLKSASSKKDILKESIKKEVKARKSVDKISIDASNIISTLNNSAGENTTENLEPKMEKNESLSNFSELNKTEQEQKTKTKTPPTNQKTEQNLFQCPICRISCQTKLKTIQHATKIHFRRELSISFKKVYKEKISECPICNATSKNHLLNLNHIGTVHKKIYEFMSPGKTLLTHQRLI
jgi:hypothetical protein